MVDGWPDGHGRRAAGHQPGDGVQVGAPLPDGRSARASRTAAPDPIIRPAVRPTQVTAAIISARTRRRYGPARLAPAHRPSPLDHLRRPPTRRPQPAAGHRPGDRRPGPLRRLPSGRARPPGPQEARPGARRWRLAGPRPGRRRIQDRGSVGYDHLEVVRRRCQPLRRRRAGHRRTRRERLVGGRAGRHRVRRGRGPDRADADRQRRELSQRTPIATTLAEPRTSATSGPGRTGRRPTARPSASSRRCSTSGPTPGHIARTTTGSQALSRWVDFYNHGRPHTAIGGHVPMHGCQQRPWESQLAHEAAEDRGSGAHDARSHRARRGVGSEQCFEIGHCRRDVRLGAVVVPFDGDEHLGGVESRRALG